MHRAPAAARLAARRAELADLDLSLTTPLRMGGRKGTTAKRRLVRLRQVDPDDLAPLSPRSADSRPPARAAHALPRDRDRPPGSSRRHRTAVMTTRDGAHAPLPHVCHATHPETGGVVLIRRGEPGYQPVERVDDRQSRLCASSRTFGQLGQLPDSRHTSSAPLVQLDAAER